MRAKPRKILAALLARYLAGELNLNALTKVLHTPGEGHLRTAPPGH
jgi:hypothetical protein